MRTDEERHEFALQEAAKAWCAPTTSDIEMDYDLAEEFAKILCPYIKFAEQINEVVNLSGVL